MGFINLGLIRISETKYAALTEEQRLSKNKIYFVIGEEQNWLYYQDKCFGKGSSSTTGDVKVVRVSSEIELPTIGDASVIYIVDSDTSIYGTTYVWSDTHLRYINTSDTWMEIQAIKGGNANS